MKVGDLIRYRSRKPSDPHPDVVEGLGVWGCVGIVIEIMRGTAWVKYVDMNGDHITCKKKDVEVINEKQ